MEFLPWPIEDPKTAMWTINVAAHSFLLLGAGWLVARLAGARAVLIRRRILVMVVVLTMLAPPAAALLHTAGLSWCLFPAGLEHPAAEVMDAEGAFAPTAGDGALSDLDRFLSTDERDRSSPGIAGSDSGRKGVLRPHLPWDARLDVEGRALSAAPAARWAAAIPWANFFLLAWLAGSILLLLRLVRGCFALIRFRRSLREISDDRLDAVVRLARQASGSRIGPALLVSDAIESPITLGIRKPAIVLPGKMLARFSYPELRAVILHELAHVSHNDVAVNLYQRLVQVLFWWNPLVHVVNAELSRAMELACDRFVLQRTGNARNYAQCLLRVAAGAHETKLLPCAPGLQSARRNLEIRIKTLLSKEVEMLSRTRGKAGAALVFSFLLAAGAVAATGMVEWPDPVQVAEPVLSDSAARAESVSDPDEESKIPASQEKKLSASRAVKQALDWLARHQHPEGYWDCDGFQEQCSQKNRCKGKGFPLNDVGATGLALLAFQGMGSTVADGPYKDVVQKAVNYLCDVQDVETGCLTPMHGTHFMYNHGVATLALTEAYGLSRSPELLKPAERAIAFIHSSKNPGKAWRYNIGAKDPRQQNDVSVTTWMLLSLASAKDFDIGVDKKDIEEGLVYINEMTDPETGRTGYNMRGACSSREAGDEMIWPFDSVEAMTGAAMFSRCVCANALGNLESQRKLLEKGAALLREKPPRWDEMGGTIDFYYWFFGTMAMYQMAGDDWLAWKDGLVEALVPNQLKEGCGKGSWDPQKGPWGDNGGRVYSTALGAFALAVVDRYERISGTNEGERAEKKESGSGKIDDGFRKKNR